MNLILTIAVGDAYQRMSALTHPAIKKYAEKIGADFQCITESDCSTPHWAKFEIYNLLNKYERILYIDTDILVREDTPNLFEIVPQNELGMFNEILKKPGGLNASPYQSPSFCMITIRREDWAVIIAKSPAATSTFLAPSRRAF